MHIHFFNGLANKPTAIVKTSNDSQTITITFPTAGYSAYAIMFGRFGYSSAVLSGAIISHGAVNEASIKCFGDQDASVTCSGHVVTVTFNQPYVQVQVISALAIS